MRIDTFDTIKGIYAFRLSEIVTDFHAHPAIELILSPSASLTVKTPEQVYQGVYFAAIDRNIPHKINCQDSQVDEVSIIMLESVHESVYNFLEKKGITLVAGCLLYTSDAADDMQCANLGGSRSVNN